jgi:hypothetical protein
MGRNVRLIEKLDIPSVFGGSLLTAGRLQAWGQLSFKAYSRFAVCPAGGAGHAKRE